MAGDTGLRLGDWRDSGRRHRVKIGGLDRVKIGGVAGDTGLRLRDSGRRHRVKIGGLEGQWQETQD